MSDLRWPDALPTLRADGLTLRPWRATDADAVFVAYQDPDILRWTRVAVPYPGCW